MACPWTSLKPFWIDMNGCACLVKMPLAFWAHRFLP